MLRDQKMGPQGPWESHHHSSMRDLSPRKGSVACNHEEQGKKQEKLGVLVFVQHHNFGCKSGARCTSFHGKVLALKR